MSRQSQISIQQLIKALLDTDTPLHPKYLYRFSDLSPTDLKYLEKAWLKIPVWRRQAIMEDVERLEEGDYLLSYEALSRFAIKDEEPRVREISIRSLWEHENADLAEMFLNMMETDVSPEVRAAAASALGKYIYLGEIEELPEKKLHKIEDRLLKICRGKDNPLVRRRALESLGFSSRKEVPRLIESAYNSPGEDWQVSALYAMGRSAHERWIPRVAEMLDHDSPNLRFDAVRAAGELEAKRCAPRLIEILDEEDHDIRTAAVWSLSQIGGEGVQEALERLYEETDDEEEADIIEDALDNLIFTEEAQLFSLVDLPDESEDMEDRSEGYLEEEVHED